jgi:hypothetical protein
MNLLSGNPVTLEVLAFTILVGILLFGAVVVLVLRTRSLPVCGNCGFSSVQRTYSSHRSLDTFARGAYTASTVLGLPACTDIPATRLWLLRLNSSGAVQSRSTEGLRHLGNPDRIGENRAAHSAQLNARECRSQVKNSRGLAI